MGTIQTTQYIIFEEKESMPKAMYIHQYDTSGILVVYPAHMVFIDGKQTEVTDEREAKKMIMEYVINKVFYKVITPTENEDLYFGVTKEFTEEDMIKVLPPNKVYSFEKIENPLL